MKTINLTTCYLFAGTAGFFLAAPLAILLHLPLLTALTGAFIACLRLYCDKIKWYDYFIYAISMFCLLLLISFGVYPSF